MRAAAFLLMMSMIIPVAQAAPLATCSSSGAAAQCTAAGIPAHAPCATPVIASPCILVPTFGATALWIAMDIADSQHLATCDDTKRECTGSFAGVVTLYARASGNDRWSITVLP